VHLDDDGEAIRRCQRGDIGGLEPLMARYQVAALRLAYLLVGERAAAEDVVQDSFMLAYQGSARFRPGSAFTPWFYHIVTNTARQYRRRAATQRVISVEWLPSGKEDGRVSQASAVAASSDCDPNVDPALHAERVEEREDVLRALAALTQKQREAVVLRYYFGCSDRELAAMLGCREGTARQRLHGGLAALRQIIMQRFAGIAGAIPADPRLSSHARGER
jgi:RNA polymerase sigma factor (sigma-70 family)